MDPVKVLHRPPSNAAAKIASDPVWFFKTFFGTELWLKQAQIVASVRDNKNTSVASCHASGKTFTAGHVALWFIHAFKNSIVISTAPTARQVEDMLWKEIRGAHGRSKYDLPGDMLTTRYNITAEWYAVGLSTDDPNKFQGYHAPHILIIVDESSGIPPTIWEAIEGVGSTGNVRILELGNPTDPTGHFADTFKSAFYAKFHIGCFDTPNFAPFRRLKPNGSIDEDKSLEALLASTYEQRQNATQASYLIAPQWVYERAIKWTPESPMFQARCLGKFPEEGEDTLIPLRHALQAKVTKENPAEGRWHGKDEWMGIDVARYGSDKTVMVPRIGNRAMSVNRFVKESTMKTAGRIAGYHKAHPWSRKNIDDIGVGGGVTDRLNELQIPGVQGVNVGEGAYDKERFINKRAEYYFALADRFREGDILIPNDDDLVNELTSLKIKWTSKGLIQIESKEDLRKRGIKSPDSADALMLAFAPTHIGSYGSAHELGPEQKPERAPGEPSGEAPVEEESSDRPITAGITNESF